MKILVAEHAGFCFGVKRAIELAEEKAKSGPLITYGPLIHNSQEIERLSKLGVQNSADGEIAGGQTVMIRTHGVGPQIHQELEKQATELVDATCPYVSKAQKLAAQAVAEGYQVVILGDREHPEVQGLRSWTGDTALVVKSWRDLEGMELPEHLAILAQTTEKEERFTELVSYLQARVTDLKAINTICSATKLRQQAVEKLAQEAELILIIGGKHSSNTRKLWEICQDHHIPSYLIEGPEELQKAWFQGINCVGISAGASTPAWIVEEVIKRMEEIKEDVVAKEEQVETNVEPVQEEEQMPSMNDDTYFRSFQEGDLVKGKVVKLTNDEVLLEIGGKSEGILPNSELAYSKVDPRELFAIGDELLVEVLKEDKEGNMILSRKRAVVDEAFEKLEKAQEEDSIITAKVSEVVKGGLVVDVGIRGFVPASQIDRSFVEDLSQYLHQELRFKVIDLNREANKVVLSRRVVLEEEYQVQKNAIWSELAEGQVRQGVVKRLATFGAFVDLGGVDGLLHVSEMSWTHVMDPAQIVKVGDQLEVYVLKVDREKEKVSLTLKQLLKSPWELVQEKYQAGMVLEGKVMRIVPFGAFIELEPGIEGLAHISQLSTKRVNKVEEVLKVGEIVKVKILEIDLEKKRISLSLKEVDTDVEKAQFQAFIEQQPAQDRVTIGEALQQKKE